MSEFYDFQSIRQIVDSKLKKDPTTKHTTPEWHADMKSRM